jgi:hypothetical protein
VTENRQDARDQQSTPRLTTALIAAAETLRSGGAPAADDGKAPKEEQKLSIWWRVFGGTMLSIAALAVVTVYQQFSGALNDVRANINHLTEARGELVQKDEFGSRMTSVWNSIKELQALNATVTGLKERALLRNQQEKTDDEAREAMHKELQTLTTAVTALQERLLVLDQRIKQEQEHKELMRELHQLRERLAGLEGRQGGGVPAKAERGGDQ